MKRITTLMAIVGIGMLVAGAGSAAARGAGHGRGGPGRGMGPCGGGLGPRMAAMLELSTEQQQAIAKLRDGMQEQTAAARAVLETKRTELQALWQEATPDRNALLAKHAEMDPYRNELRAAHIDFRLAVIDVLTPAQREKARSLFQERHGHRGAMGGGFGGFGMGECPSADSDD